MRGVPGHGVMKRLRSKLRATGVADVPSKATRYTSYNLHNAGTMSPGYLQVQKASFKKYRPSNKVVYMGFLARLGAGKIPRVCPSPISWF